MNVTVGKKASQSMCGKERSEGGQEAQVAMRIPLNPGAWWQSSLTLSSGMV